MKTIIGFDSWAGGCHNFSRLVPALRDCGYRLILVHIGSWGHDAERPAEELIDGLLIRDISYYGKLGFDEILALEQPEAVLFLSTRAFAHQAFNRYATQRRIPTVHLYHGLVSVQPIGSNEVSYSVSWINKVRQIVKRINKNVFKLWPVFGTALLKTRAPPRSWYWFMREVYFKGTSGYRGIAPPDSRTTAGCVYTNADISHMVNTYGIPRDHVFAVGNPDLVHFGLGRDIIGACLSTVAPNPLWVMYIETALAASGYAFTSRDEFVEHLLYTRDRLYRQGFRLTIKPHPASVKSGLSGYLANSGLDICSNEEFLKRLRGAAAAIVEPSTAAMIPALLGLPIFLAGYGRLASQRYGSVLTDYPRAVTLEDLERFGDCLHQIQHETDRFRFDRWVEDNAGPLPAVDMPARVAAVLDKVVRRRRNDYMDQ